MFYDLLSKVRSLASRGYHFPDNCTEKSDKLVFILYKRSRRCTKDLFKTLSKIGWVFKTHPISCF